VPAFYKNCWEADLGIIDRIDFETLLKAHYTNRPLQDKSSWTALRNMVFACGYRSILAKDPAISFVMTQAKAGRFFNNALSVFTRLLFHPPSSLMAVRAITLMVWEILVMKQTISLTLNAYRPVM
jgi:hypothetical protein